MTTYALKHPRSDNLTKGRLGSLDQGEADVTDSECSLERVDDVVVDDRVDVDGDSILGRRGLHGAVGDLDLSSTTSEHCETRRALAD